MRFAWRSFELLKRNLEAAGLSSRVATLPWALSSHAGERSLTYYPRMPGNASFWPQTKWATRERFFSPARRKRAFIRRAWKSPQVEQEEISR